ncbi:SafA/ExsA family spore coat assembly protein [Anoxybacteroides tepidamans]|uniref:SafA/ExsA family spore coat assembly protein n=1 Tax=Anoxybacteroides tepidamans TaxID=265948 RepID=UPI0004896B0B|nr:SafA/ExsA family spore coat assembly protein [Anoxybacillus tepidamans]
MKIHIVQKGDTLWKIAQKYGVDFEQLKKINGQLSNPDDIMPGMKIKIPTAGVPVKKEAPKKEAKINFAPKKEQPIQQHPFANEKPFVSFNMEAEITPNVNVNPPKQELPKAPIQETPKELPKAPTVEVPKEMPKAPIANVPKEIPKEAPKTPAYEGPKPNPAEMNKSPEKDWGHNIPPVSPQTKANFPNQMPTMPPIPPKPANILPNIMNADVEHHESPENNVQADLPPELPTIPYVPVAPQQQMPMYTAPAQPPLQEQQCIPVTPLMPGYGFYYPPVPMAPIAPMASPMMSPPPLHGESSSHQFPGIHESGESHEWTPPQPPMSQTIPASPQPQTMPTAPMQGPGSYYAAPMTPSYGWQPQTYPQPYTTAAPYSPMYQQQPLGYPGYQAGAPTYSPAQMQPMYGPAAQPSSFPPRPQQFFMMPEYGESSEREE